MNDAVVITRHYDPATDEGFVYSTWRNSAFYLRAAVESGDPSKFFREKTKRIREILKAATVRIACLEDSPLFIVGMSVTTDSHLDWVYVKSDYRGKGIARLLVPITVATFTNEDLTKIGKAIALKKKLTLKENAHDERQENGSRLDAGPSGSGKAR